MADILGLLLCGAWVGSGVLGEAIWSAKDYETTFGLAWRRAVFGGGINFLLAVMSSSAYQPIKQPPGPRIVRISGKLAEPEVAYQNPEMEYDRLLSDRLDG